MSETREVFEMVTKQTEPDLGSWKQQEDRQRKRARMRKAGAFVMVAVLIVGGGVAFALMDDDTTTGAVDQPTQSPPQTVSPEGSPFASAYVGIVDLATGEVSTIPVAPSASAIDVSPDGAQIAYVKGGVVNIAAVDGSNDRALDGTRGDPGGPQWSPDGSSIVYQGPGGGSSVGNLFIIDLGSGKVRRITDLEGVETNNLDYLSPTFDPTGRTVMFHLPTVRGGEERYDLWSVPVTGGELTLVRRGAVFGDYSPDGSQIAFVEDGEFGGLFVAPTSGGEARNLASGGMVVPRWSPDGTRIAYNDDGDGVVVVDVETGEQTFVVETRHLPTWIDDDTLSLTP